MISARGLLPALSIKIVSEKQILRAQGRGIISIVSAGRKTVMPPGPTPCFPNLQARLFGATMGVVSNTKPSYP